MTIHRAAAPLMAALLLVGALAGCTASISRTVSADAVAKTAAGALETEYSITVDGMDCGSDSITLREGEQVACTVTVDGSGRAPAPFTAPARTVFSLCGGGWTCVAREDAGSGREPARGD